MMRAALAAGGFATLGTLPLFLLSAQAVVVRAELGLDAAELGLAASCFFGVAAAVSLTCGRLLDRLSSQVATLFAAGLTAAGCVGVAWGARSFAALVVVLAVGGAGNALLQMSANVMLARVVPPGRRGMAYGIKQSAIPVAVMVGGLAVPTAGALVGWRGTFAITAGLCLILPFLGVRGGRAGATETPAGGAPDLPPRSALLVSAAGTMLASSAAVSLGAFLPSWAHEVGFTTSQAALLLSAGGALALLGRLGSGFAADRRSGRHLPVIMVHLVVGAGGIALISFDQGVSVLVGTLVAFGIGWSWPGVMIFALVRLGRDSPGSASSAVQGGNFAGAALGPVLFGYLVSSTDYAVAWRVAAATMLVAAGLVLLARRIFVADRRRRPPVRAFH